MPWHVRNCFLSLSEKHNLNNKKILEAQEVSLLLRDQPEESTFDDPIIPEVTFESSRFSRNIILIFKTILQDPYFSTLFTPSENHFLSKFHSLSLTSQNIFLKLLSRKRVWFNSRCHLEKYCESEEEIRENVSELVGGEFLCTEISVFEDLLA